MRFLLCFLLVFAVSGFVRAQTDSAYAETEEEEPSFWSKPSDEEKGRLGIVMGMQASTLRGGGVANNRAMFGLLGGGYGRIKLVSNLWLQQQLQVSFRGSNFGNDAGEISSIRMLCLDAPLYFFFRLSKNSQHKLGLGVQYSTLLTSDIYVDKQSFPAGRAPAIDKNDWGAAIAYQYQLDYLAFQVAVKSGFRNLNLGRPWPGPNQTTLTNNNGVLNHFGVELNLIF